MAEGFEERRKDFHLSPYFPEQGSLSPGALVFCLAELWRLITSTLVVSYVFGGVVEWRVKVGAEFCLELVLWANFNIKNSQLKDQPKIFLKRGAK